MYDYVLQLHEAERVASEARDVDAMNQVSECCQCVCADAFEN